MAEHCAGSGGTSAGAKALFRLRNGAPLAAAPEERRPVSKIRPLYLWKYRRCRRGASPCCHADRRLHHTAFCSVSCLRPIPSKNSWRGRCMANRRSILPHFYSKFCSKFYMKYSKIIAIGVFLVTLETGFNVIRIQFDRNRALGQAIRVHQSLCL